MEIDLYEVWNIICRLLLFFLFFFLGGGWGGTNGIEYIHCRNKRIHEAPDTTRNRVILFYLAQQTPPPLITTYSIIPDSRLAQKKELKLPESCDESPTERWLIILQYRTETASTYTCCSCTNLRPIEQVLLRAYNAG